VNYLRTMWWRRGGTGSCTSRSGGPGGGEGVAPGAALHCSANLASFAPSRSFILSIIVSASWRWRRGGTRSRTSRSGWPGGDEGDGTKGMMAAFHDLTLAPAMASTSSDDAKDFNDSDCLDDEDDEESQQPNRATRDNHGTRVDETTREGAAPKWEYSGRRSGCSACRRKSAGRRVRGGES
jgi:hypothetical protein